VPTLKGIASARRSFAGFVMSDARRTENKRLSGQRGQLHEPVPFARKELKRALKQRRICLQQFLHKFSDVGGRYMRIRRGADEARKRGESSV
jgi:hypothetical protein